MIVLKMHDDGLPASVEIMGVEFVRAAPVRAICDYQRKPFQADSQIVVAMRSLARHALLPVSGDPNPATVGKSPLEGDLDQALPRVSE